VAKIENDIRDVEVTDDELWVEGPPHEIFKRMRTECPVHWTDQVVDLPEEAGFWSVTTAEDVHEVSRDWRTYSSELGGFTAGSVLPMALMRAMFIGMDPPKHDRVKALFQAGFTPKRIAAHEGAIRRITSDVLDRLEDRECCDLVTDVAQPVVSRVIGSFMGVPPEDDAMWAELMNATLGAGDADLNPAGIEGVMEKLVPALFASCDKLIAERRERPTDDLMSVLVHAEVDGQRLEEHEIVMGFVPADGGRQRLDEGDLLQRHARPDGRRGAAPAGPRGPVADSRRGRGVAAHVPGLRPLPPHRGLRCRTARAGNQRGRKGRDVVRLLQP
jgi:cholest-4-en-3-one 26-monooxygenase